MIMNNNKSKWTEDVIQSMQGSQRAVPKPELFIKIQNEINDLRDHKITQRQLRNYVAAGIVIIMINVFIVFVSKHNKSSEAKEILAQSKFKPIVYSYQMYNQ